MTLKETGVENPPDADLPRRLPVALLRLKVSRVTEKSLEFARAQFDCPVSICMSGTPLPMARRLGSLPCQS